MRHAAIAASVIAALQWNAGTHAQSSLFVRAPPVAVGRGSGEVALADVDGDGHLDLVSKHLLDQRIDVRRGDGSANFGGRPAMSLRLPYQPGAMALGYLDRDGVLDLAIASREGDNESVHILRGDGRGGFQEVSASPIQVSASFDFYKPILHVADVNEDGFADIAIANGRRSRIDILPGDGEGRFRAPVRVPLEPGGDFYSFAVADVDQDAHLDLVTVDDDGVGGGGGRLQVRRGDGRAGFVATGTMPPVLPNPRIGALTDVSGDGRADVVITHGRSRQIEVVLNGGGGRLQPAATYTVAGEANEIVVHDVNADGRRDLVIATVNSVTVLLGAASGFTPATGSPFGAGPGAYRVAVGDVNRDRRLDVVASSFDGDAVTLLLGR